MSTSFAPSIMEFRPEEKSISETTISSTSVPEGGQSGGPSSSSVEGAPAMSFPYHHTPGQSSGEQLAFPRSKSISSDDGLDLQGPLEIDGSLKSGRSINLNGDFVVNNGIDAFGTINVTGHVNCSGPIKAYGNIEINGSVVARNEIKGFGKLRVVGSLEGTELEIYGNLSINGQLKCKRLVVFGSLTLIGPESGYSVEQSEEIAGAKLRREQEADWDW